jgi:hypothetical protein
MNSSRAQEGASSLRLDYISPGTSRMHTEIKDRPGTAHAMSYLTWNLAIKIKGKTIQNNTPTEKAHHNSIIK